MRPSVILTDGKRGRRMRRPQHRFHLRNRPWQIVPFLLAPVLPGETMKNALVQARCVTDPINNPLIGWWLEYYLFYVKHRDMEERDTLTKMMLDPATSLAGLDSATSVPHYHENGADLAINWSLMCYKRVVEEYFRNPGELYSDHQIGNYAAANINFESYLDSAINDADFVTANDISLTSVGSTFGAEVRASEVETAMRQYELLSSMNLVDMTYDDFLRSYGVTLPEPEEHVPELLRYTRQWQYPSNTIDPTNGTPRSAVSWSVAFRADKDRFFKEPGFIYGVTVCRPKIYLSNLSSSAAMLMRDAYSWLPAVMADDPRTSLVKVTALDPPLTANTDAYWIDVKDLLLYGDQFYNFAIAAADVNEVALPLATLAQPAAGRPYAASADADALFVGASPANQVRMDGVASLQIATHSWMKDSTPMSVGARAND